MTGRQTLLRRFRCTNEIETGNRARETGENIKHKQIARDDGVWDLFFTTIMTLRSWLRAATKYRRIRRSRHIFLRKPLIPAIQHKHRYCRVWQKCTHARHPLSMDCMCLISILLGHCFKRATVLYHDMLLNPQMTTPPQEFDTPFPTRGMCVNGERCPIMYS